MDIKLFQIAVFASKCIRMRSHDACHFDEVAECGLARPAPTRIGPISTKRGTLTERTPLSFQVWRVHPSRRQSSAH